MKKLRLMKDWENWEIACKIDSEGFDYFFDGWLGESDIEAPEFLKAVQDYQAAKQRLEKIMEDNDATLEAVPEEDGE